MKNLTVILLLLSSITFAQERMILRTNGEQIKLNHKKDLRKAITEAKIKRSDGKVFENQFASKPSNIAGLVDTISYRSFGGTWNTNFGFFGQDEMLQWFEAPADMTIKGIGFTCSDDTGAENATISLRLIRLNWTKEQLKNFSADTEIGYYPSSGDGMNNTDPFGENATGNWVSADENNPLPPWTNHENPDSNTFKYDLWSDSGLGWPIIPVFSPFTYPIYQWVATEELGSEPTVSKGEIFAVVATHDGITLDADRIGFWSDATIGYPGWKFYENGKTDATVDAGWWVRNYTWDFALAVDITGDLSPTIKVTQITTTIVTDPRKVLANVVDTNPSGGSVGVAEVNLKFKVSDGDTQSVAMVNIGGDDFEGYIPHFACSEIEYWVEAEDVNGNKSESKSYKFWFFCPEQKTLFVLNGYTEPTGYPQSYYFGPSFFDYRQDMDIWSYGSLTKELVDNYNYIIENSTSGPNVYNKDVIKEWFASDNMRVYILWGEEWLGAQNGYMDIGYQTGDFEYDILGLTLLYNDVSYDGTSGQELPSKFMPQEGTDLGGPMFDLITQLNTVDSTKIDSVLYDPIYEIGLDNWHDGFEVREDDPTLEVFMKAETRGIMGSPNVKDVNVGVSRNIGQNHMTVFMAYDPISINSSPYYYWFGRSDVSSQMQAIRNLPLEGDVDDGDLNNIKFSLSQNYPNPFNPSTTIKYSIPSVQTPLLGGAGGGFVSLKIYDILGREIATLINKEQKAGNYEVNFNASKLSSGVYFYKLQAGNFSQTKKLLLLK